MRRLLCNCGILESTDKGFSWLEKGFLGIDGAFIDYIGATRPTAAYDEERVMSETLLIPGLVNAHTHTPMTLLRGVGSGLPLQNWLFDTVFPVEDRLTPEMIRVGSELALLEMLSTGTTSFTDMYMEPQETAEAVLSSGMKANLCRPVQCFDPSEPPEENFRVRQSVELYDRYNDAGDGRLKIDFCVHAEYTCTAPGEDMELMREHGVSAVHCPSSNMKLGSGFAPVREMLGRGLNVALGTDGAASNNNLNMLEELHLAFLIHNGVAGDPTALLPEDALRMATVNGPTPGSFAWGKGRTSPPSRLRPRICARASTRWPWCAAPPRARTW